MLRYRNRRRSVWIFASDRHANFTLFMNGSFQRRAHPGWNLGNFQPTPLSNFLLEKWLECGNSLPKCYHRTANGSRKYLEFLEFHISHRHLHSWSGKFINTMFHIKFSRFPRKNKFFRWNYHYWGNFPNTSKHFKPYYVRMTEEENISTTNEQP